MMRRGFLTTLLGLATVPLFGRKPRPSALALLRDSSQEWVKGPLKGDVYPDPANQTAAVRRIVAIDRRRRVVTIG